MVAFLWLDHWEQGCELGAVWLDEIGRQSGWSFFRLLGMIMREILLESWCVMEGPVQASFIGQGMEREDMNEQEWPAMKVLQIHHSVGSFVLRLMAFDGGEMARHYWVVCDHKMLNCYGIFQCLSQLKL
jgi:hypothetical protein